ncbi:MAG TPA: hypothetical protein VFY48_08900 [Solirubrobacterales bacterium]|nr:hypothetical protein [Solirubrobacterales bacterium]
MAVAMGCLVLGVTGAVAAPPANDDFVDREILSGPLPIEVERSNVEASREDGEPWLMTGKGRTLWYEWEAEETGFVTVGTCESGFPTQVGVYTGTAVNALALVADSSMSGPGCPTPYSGRQATFRAEAGSVYEIVADGDGFYFPPSPPPSGEGLIPLQVEATPPPANDDFGDASVLSGRIEEEPGEPPWYFGSATGYNWGASKELGEPEHAGDPGGSSVWYRWTAPVTGTARLSAQGNWFETLIAVYEGDALGGLTPVASGDFLGTGDFPVTAGRTYRIAVDGKRDPGSGEASTAQFWLYAFIEDLQLPAADRGSPPPGPPADTTTPQTRVSKLYLMRKPPVFFALRLRSSEPGSTFRCRFDRRPFRPCGRTQGVRGLGPGRHRFEAFAVDTAGNADPTPAVVRFGEPKLKPKETPAKGKR